MMNCQYCKSSRLVKNGLTNKRDRQRYTCQDCGRNTYVSLSNQKCISIETKANESFWKYQKDKEYKELNQQYESLLKQLDYYQHELESIRSIATIESFNIEPKFTETQSESAAIIDLSDWHIEEEVDPKTVNGLNSYNLDIAKERINHLSNRLVKLIRMYQKDTNIAFVVIHLGGDFITGNIHQENLENCLLTPIQATIYAEKLIVGIIDFLLNHTDLKIIVPCNSGNHARITQKIHHSTESGNSLEYYMYHVLAKHYEHYKRVKFIIPESYFCYIDIYNLVFRFSHGHSVRYIGGVGGVFVPLKRAIHQWNRSRNADVDIMGHFHQSFFLGSIITNGSLIGYNAFALRSKFEFEPPKQNLMLVNKKLGLTIFSPIYFS